MSGALCLAGLTGAVLAILPGPAFTLSWTHSVERTEWREAWRLEDGRLRLERAWVKGTGAGMEPGPGARLADGWWVWEPALPPQNRLVLAASAFTDDHRMCIADDCRPLAEWVGADRDAPVVVEPCR